MFAGLGADGTAAAAGSPSSSIRAEVQDPAPGVSSMGGKLVFATSAAGTVVPVDRMTIDNQVRLHADTTTLLWESSHLCHGLSALLVTLLADWCRYVLITQWCPPLPPCRVPSRLAPYPSPTRRR